MKKATKAKKVSMKRKMAMKKSVIARGKVAKARVFRGSKAKTVGGLKKADLVKNRQGKVVSRKASNRAKNSKSGKKIVAWSRAFVAARKALGVKGFKPCKRVPPFTKKPWNFTESKCFPVVVLIY